MTYLASQGIENGKDYYDPNRVLKIKDRLPAIDELILILDKVLKRLRAASRDCIPKEMIKQNN